MSGGPRVRSTNLADFEQRPVLVPAGNKARTGVEARKPVRKSDSSPETESKSKEKRLAQNPPTLSPPMRNLSAPSILRHGNQLLRGNSSLNASCSSDASSDSSHSRASTGRISAPLMRRKLGGASNMGLGAAKVVVDDGAAPEVDGLGKKRCAWVTSNTDPSYAAFHDEEWGVPVHDDSKLFELLSLSSALAELAWPTILNKRNIFREVFLHFDPVSVSKLNEKKISGPGSPGSTLLSELKMRNIVENARQVCKVIEEFGSFSKYIWSFMNKKPIVNKFRYPRQVPVKTSKAEMISKDLVRRGFRGVGPTAVYSFMQAAGLTNDHLLTCFRFQECVAAGEGKEKDDKIKGEEDKLIDMDKLELARALDEVSVCFDG
ncbi:uncharacterized protein LOC110684975 isoform X2 [Chenopodium quinoa]|uniref:uncharacterized protein LOC110684975 isoform X2 n=1 Tax=Chenopodium quinoa TaxID=63459 RepID=UPI000B794D90|nr:uncharacterized protein LOC110684975 isoform X2 [Chenopodium quinoa]